MYEEPRGALGIVVVRLDTAILRVSQAINRFPPSARLISPVLEMLEVAKVDIAYAIEWVEESLSPEDE